MFEGETEIWGKEIEGERLEHNELYAEQAKRIIEPLDWKSYYDAHRPAHEKDGELYGLDVRMLMDIVDSELNQRPKDIRVLDYACGIGEFSTILAQRGYKVKGFDISDTGIEVANELAKRYKVGANVEFSAANAQDLPYDDNGFDMVIGKAVLHHIIKYPKTADELYRVMKPGGVAIFCEGAASNPLIKFGRRFTLIEELGDVPLTASGVRRWGDLFTKVTIDGHFFFYMLKRLGYKWNTEKYQEQSSLGKSFLFRMTLRMCLLLDRLVVEGKPWSAILGGRYFIRLMK